MIPVYIASTDRFAVCESVICHSIEANTREDTHIQIIRPADIGMAETGCTGFTNVRYAVPELLRRDGYDFGIYLDVDMLLLADIAELYQYCMTGRWVCLKDLSTEVSVISADIRLPSIQQIGKIKKHELDRIIPKSAKIPLVWNAEDRYHEAAKLLHFTDLKCQPWFYDNHPDPQAVSVWKHYLQASLNDL